MLNTVLAMAVIASPASAKPKVAPVLAEDLVITRVFLNPNGGSDDDRGLEMFEIKNIGTNSIDLGANNVAFVVVENEKNGDGELDSYYQFTGTLAAGDSFCVRDFNNAGTPAVTALSAPNDTAATGTTVNVEYFAGHTGTDLSNSGGNFLLVKGFHAAAATWAGHMDTNNNLIFDWKANGVGADDVWDSEYDALVNAPDSAEYGAGFDDFTVNLTLPHKAVGVQNSVWTGDYFFRLRNTSTGTYSHAFQMDVLAPNMGSIINDLGDTPDQRGLMTGGAWSITGTGSVPGTVNYYVVDMSTGNNTDWANYTGITILGTLYVHA